MIWTFADYDVFCQTELYDGIETWWNITIAFLLYSIIFICIFRKGHVIKILNVIYGIASSFSIIIATLPMYLSIPLELALIITKLFLFSYKKLESEINQAIDTGCFLGIDKYAKEERSKYNELSDDEKEEIKRKNRANPPFIVPKWLGVSITLLFYIIPLCLIYLY